MSAAQAMSRRRRVVPRPVAVLIASVIGLGALGGLVGAALGGIGAAAASHETNHVRDGFHHQAGSTADDVTDGFSPRHQVGSP